MIRALERTKKNEISFPSIDAIDEDVDWAQS